MRRTRLTMLIYCLGLVMLTAVAARAQLGPAGPRRGFRPMVQGGPPMFDFMGGKTVTGAPYSAEATFEHSQTLSNGNLIDQKNSATIYRDGQGRTRLEETRPAGSKNTRQIVRITDPVAGVAYVLNPAKKTAQKFTLPPSRPGRIGQAPRAATNPNVNDQSLGSKNLEGLLVEGTQITRTIPAGQMGNSAPIQISTTRWYSTDLSLSVRTETTDPLRGNTITALTNISRSEPAGTLFQVPSDYTIVSAGPKGRPRFAPPAPPQQ
jgi:hypothetical protein